ncbi:F-box/LRR-repeat protein 16 [Armadillidium vulgare]|nr:F-box/LRR-repeat protein 16 [Armadillidium vulgare]
MSLSAQEVVERAGVELSRCISGLGLRPKKPEGKMGSVRRGGVMEKVANVFCGNSTAATTASSMVSGRNCKTDSNKPIPPEKPSRFLLGKVRNGGVPHTVVNTATVNGHQGSGSPRLNQTPKQQRSPARTRVRQAHPTRPTTWEELVRDETFLNRFFHYFPAIDRATLAQVCTKWRSVLYQQKFWHGIRPVLHCRQVRGPTTESTAEMRRKFYISVQTRGFDSLVLVCASDEDLLDLVANYAVNRTKNLRAVGLRCSSVTDKGVETLLDHLNGVYQLELQGCNEITEAGLWGCLSPRIVSLSVADCINIADEAVGAIAQLLPSLYELNLQAYHVTDAALAFFSPRQTTTLSILRLHSCWELTNHAIVNIEKKNKQTN